jgi:hypothetical protein
MPLAFRFQAIAGYCSSSRTIRFPNGADSDSANPDNVDGFNDGQQGVELKGNRPTPRPSAARDFADNDR